MYNTVREHVKKLTFLANTSAKGGGGFPPPAAKDVSFWSYKNA